MAAGAYLAASAGNAGLALRLAVADALAGMDACERRAFQAERLVSRGFVRSAFHRNRKP